MENSAALSCGQIVNKCIGKARRGFTAPTIFLLLLAVMVVLTSASIKPSWVVPGGTVSAIPGVLGSQSAKFCALTFDDGPDKKYTMQIKGILDSYGVKATFFVLGNQAQDRLDQVLALHNSGHEIASHSYSHPDFTKISTKQKRQELSKLNSLLEPLGITPKWFRPPYGAYNKTAVNIAANQGLETVLWTLDPKDWARPGVDRIRQRVLTQAKSGDVVLLHSTNAQTVAALPGIIEGLRKKDFQFVTMSLWREIVTGQKSVPPLQPSQPIPYPTSQAKKREIAKNIFSQISAIGQLCLPQHIRRSTVPSWQLAPELTVYANFQDPAGCYAIQQTGRSSGVFTYHSQAITPGPFYLPLDFSPASTGSGNQGLPPNLYYHRGDAPHSDKHNPPEWPRPAAKPSV